MLNGTSEAKGGRIVTTVLAPTYRRTGAHLARPRIRLESKPGECAVLAQTDDFHADLLHDPATADGLAGERPAQPTVGLPPKSATSTMCGLSTAAHNSARFPHHLAAGSGSQSDAPDHRSHRRRRVRRELRRIERHRARRWRFARSNPGLAPFVAGHIERSRRSYSIPRMTLLSPSSARRARRNIRQRRERQETGKAGVDDGETLTEHRHADHDVRQHAHRARNPCGGAAA